MRSSHGGVICSLGGEQEHTIGVKGSDRLDLGRHPGLKEPPHAHVLSALLLLCSCLVSFTSCISRQGGPVLGGRAFD